MSEGLEETAIQRNIFTKYRIRASSRHTIILCYQSYRDYCSHFHTTGGGKGRPAIAGKKQIAYWRDVSSRPETFATRSWGRCRGTSHNCLPFLWKKLKMLPSRLRIGQGLSKTDKNTRVFWSAMVAEARRKSQLLSTHHFFWRVQFLVAWCCKQAKLQALGCQRSANVRVTAELFNVNGLECYLQIGGNWALCFWQRYCYQRQIQKDITVFSFSQACQLTFRHDLLAV